MAQILMLRREGPALNLTKTSVDIIVDFSIYSVIALKCAENNALHWCPTWRVFDR